MQLSDAQKVVIERSKESLIDYSIATNTNYKPNWHHELIAKELEHIEKYGDRDYKILIVTVPPRHGKSQECTIDFPSWYLGRNPQKEIITASYSADLAQDFGGKTRDKVKSPAYRAIFHDLQLREDQDARGRWFTTIGGGYTSVGVGGPLTGKGAHILIIDDPIKNAEEAASQVYRDKTFSWFTSTAFTRLHPGGVVIIVLTRWHVDDIAGRVLQVEEFKDRIRVIKLPAIATKDTPQRKKGEALWPSRYSLASLNESKVLLGPYDFQALYQCNPILTEDQEFKPEWYKYITQEEVDVMQTTNYLTVDTAFSKKAQADNTGFCDNSFDRDAFWNIKVWGKKLGPEELVDNLFALHVRRKYSLIGIERTAYLDGLKPYLDAEQRKRRIFLPIVELTHSQVAKEVRIRGIIPYYSSGSIRHINGECIQLENEQMEFPHGSKDDCLDALAYMPQLFNQDRSGDVVINKPNYTSYNRVSSTPRPTIWDDN